MKALSLCLFVVAAAAGCRPDLPGRGCDTVADCFSGELCLAGSCVTGGRLADGDGGVPDGASELPDMGEQPDMSMADAASSDGALADAASDAGELPDATSADAAVADAEPADAALADGATDDAATDDAATDDAATDALVADPDAAAAVDAAVDAAVVEADAADVDAEVDASLVAPDSSVAPQADLGLEAPPQRGAAGSDG